MLMSAARTELYIIVFAMTNRNLSQCESNALTDVTTYATANDMTVQLARNSMVNTVDA